MAYNAKAVANYLLDLANVEGEAITPMKLQKLIYYAHGWHLAVTGQPLITDKVEAWEYGPVVPSVYQDFKRFGNEPITSPAQDFRWDNGQVAVSTPEIPVGDAHEATREILRRVWDVYKGRTALELSRMTHAPDSPWSQVAAPFGGKAQTGVTISNRLIRSYFAEMGETDGGGESHSS